MVVKEGYKNTEVGVIPEDWEVKKQMDIVKYINGRAYSIHEWETKGVPVVRLQNLTNKGGDFYYSQLKLPEYQYMYKGDLIYMWSASFGPYIWWGDKAIFHYHIWRIECDKVKIDKSFYYYKLIEITEELKKGTSGSTMLHLTKGFMENYLVSLPPLPEQQAIATVLSDTDNLIQTLEKKIVKKELIKKGAMQELLEPKEGWERKTLGEVAKVNMGQSPLSEFYNTEGVGLPLIQGNADIKKRKTIIRYFTSMVTKTGKTGDVIMSVRAPVGEISKATFDCCLGRGVCSISFDNDYIYQYLIFIENSWAKLSTGSTFDSVNSKQVRELEIPIPISKSEQIHIAQILSDMDNEIESLQEKLSKYKQLKQGLMQELLTGRIRLV